MCSHSCTILRDMGLAGKPTRILFKKGDVLLRLRAGEVMLAYDILLKRRQIVRRDQWVTVYGAEDAEATEESESFQVSIAVVV